MVEKIYSRRRIKKKKASRVWSILLISILALIVFFLYSAYPIFKSSCENEAKASAIRIMHYSANEIIKEYEYNDLVNISKDNDGKVNFLQINSKKINEIIAKISLDIQKRIDESPTIVVYINPGTISGLSIFKSFWPKFDIELEASGSIETKLKSSFTSVGINQTSHRIICTVFTKVGILTPFGSFSKIIEEDILLVESVIVGEIPETYYKFSGGQEEEIAGNILN